MFNKLLILPFVIAITLLTTEVEGDNGTRSPSNETTEAPMRGNTTTTLPKRTTKTRSKKCRLRCKCPGWGHFYPGPFHWCDDLPAYDECRNFKRVGEECDHIIMSCRPYLQCCCRNVDYPVPTTEVKTKGPTKPVTTQTPPTEATTTAAPTPPPPKKKTFFDADWAVPTIIVLTIIIVIGVTCCICARKGTDGSSENGEESESSAEEYDLDTFDEEELVDKAISEWYMEQDISRRQATSFALSNYAMKGKVKYRRKPKNVDNDENAEMLMSTHPSEMSLIFMEAGTKQKAPTQQKKSPLGPTSKTFTDLIQMDDIVQCNNPTIHISEQQKIEQVDETGQKSSKGNKDNHLT